LALAKGWCRANERSLGMQDVEIDDLRRKIERYENLLRSVADERTRREIERLLEEAEQRLGEIEKRS
jgi:predicted  nucleic acid-binding Zn-ribbon protein